MENDNRIVNIHFFLYKIIIRAHLKMKVYSLLIFIIKSRLALVAITEGRRFFSWFVATLNSTYLPALYGYHLKHLSLNQNVIVR